jgi:flagellin-like hook-associated protein FlgL
MGESFEEFEAELHSAIAKLHVSDENVTASDSHVDHIEMSAAMRTYTEHQIQLHAGSAPRAPADAARRTILDLLQ